MNYELSSRFLRFPPEKAEPNLFRQGNNMFQVVWIRNMLDTHAFIRLD